VEILDARRSSACLPRTDRERQAALLEGQTYINAEQFVLTLRDDLANHRSKTVMHRRWRAKSMADSWTLAKHRVSSDRGLRLAVRHRRPQLLYAITSREALSAIQASLQGTIDRIARRWTSG